MQNFCFGKKQSWFCIQYLATDVALAAAGFLMAAFLVAMAWLWRMAKTAFMAAMTKWWRLI